MEGFLVNPINPYTSNNYPNSDPLGRRTSKNKI
jgi:hypothetical protein